MSTLLTEPRPALTTLSEEEGMFQEAVRDFARAEIAPFADQWDRAEALTIRLRDAATNQRLYEGSLYWHMRTDEVTLHLEEEAEWRARIEAGDARPAVSVGVGVLPLPAAAPRTRDV